MYSMRTVRIEQLSRELKKYSKMSIKAWVLLQPQNSTCWCRATSMDTPSANPNSLPLQLIAN
ncbi:ATV_HP_G0014980.mRNA.1.CDS.1 [Saccharomyces cerevisiae]|nr:ATV_HP_G0014980.mRNA.1.CDS.1 [Saccharomyces cerevisiae]CAI6949943.1 ATV_HP_G0014980.mRNA.1.CDS.1 [Saccharomyces cerevisiae]